MLNGQTFIIFSESKDIALSLVNIALILLKALSTHTGASNYLYTLPRKGSKNIWITQISLIFCGILWKKGSFYCRF